MNHLGLTVFAGKIPGLVLDFDKESKEYTIEFVDGRVVKTAVVNWEPSIPADSEVAKYRLANNNSDESLAFSEEGWDIISNQEGNYYWETGAEHTVTYGEDEDEDHMRSDIDGNSVIRHNEKELYNNRKDEEGNPEQNFPDGEEEEIMARRQSSPEKLQNNEHAEDVPFSDEDEDAVQMPPMPADLARFLERAETAEPDYMKTDREFPSGEYNERSRIPAHSHVREQNAWDDEHYANNPVCEDCGDPLVNGHCYSCLDKKNGMAPEKYGELQNNTLIPQSGKSSNHKTAGPAAALAAPIVEAVGGALGLGGAAAAAEGAGAAAAGGLGAAEGAGALSGVGGSLLGRSPGFMMGNLVGRAMSGDKNVNENNVSVESPQGADYQSITLGATQPDTEIYAYPNRGDNSNPDIGGTGGYNQTHGDGPEYIKDVNDIGGTIAVIRRFTDTGDMDGAISHAMDVLAEGIPLLLEFTEKEESGEDKDEIKSLDELLEAVFGEEYTEARDEAKGKKKESKAVTAQDAICRKCNRSVVLGQQVCSDSPPRTDCPMTNIQAVKYPGTSTPTPSGSQTLPPSAGMGASPVINAPGGAAYAQNTLNFPVAPKITKVMQVLSVRRPKMCPYHTELTEYSLSLNDPAAALGALSQHLYSPNSCKGGWGEQEGKKCKFKSEMVHTEYWEQKEREAEERKQERERQKALEEQQIQEQPMEEIQEVLVAEDPQEPIDPDFNSETEIINESEMTNVGESTIVYNDYIAPENYADFSPTDNGMSAEEPVLASNRSWLMTSAIDQDYPTERDMKDADGPIYVPDDEVRVYEYPGDENYDEGSADGTQIEDTDGDMLEEGEIYRVGPEGQIPDVVKVVSVDPQYIDVERIDSTFPEAEGNRPYRLTLKEIMVQDIKIEKTGDKISPNEIDEEIADNLEGTPEINDDAGVGQQDTHGVTDLSSGRKASLEIDKIAANKDVRIFLKRLTQKHPQLQIQRSGSGHFKIIDGQTNRMLGIVPSSPSDPRALLNTQKDIERAIAEQGQQDQTSTEKTAGYNYSVGEQRQFVNENGTARNLDKLDLSGTHYPEEMSPTDDDYFLWG